MLSAGLGRLQLLAAPDSYQPDRYDAAGAAILYLAADALVLLPPSRLGDGQPVRWLRPLNPDVDLPDGKELFFTLVDLPATRQLADPDTYAFPAIQQRSRHTASRSGDRAGSHFAEAVGRRVVALSVGQGDAHVSHLFAQRTSAFLQVGSAATQTTTTAIGDKTMHIRPRRRQRVRLRHRCRGVRLRAMLAAGLAAVVQEGMDAAAERANSSTPARGSRR